MEENDIYELEFLSGRLRDVKNEIQTWQEDEDFFEGDQNYQRLLEEKNDLQRQIDEYVNFE